MRARVASALDEVVRSVKYVYIDNSGLPADAKA